MNVLNQRESSGPVPYDRFIKDTPGMDKPLLASKEDISFAKREMFPPAYMSTANFVNNLGTKVVHWAYDRLKDVNQQARVKAYELMAMKQLYMDLPRKSRLKVFNAQVAWDTGPLNDILTDRGGQWPSHEMLTEHGLNDKEANAYTAMTKAFDEMYQAAGINEPRIPGYFPHTRAGMYRLDIIHPQEGLFKTMMFNNTWGGLRIAKKAAEAEGMMTRVTDPKNSTKYSFVSDIQKNVQMLKTKGKLGQAAADMLIRIQNKVQEGTITEALERHGIAGYDQETGVKPEGFNILNKKHNDFLMQTFDRAMQDGVRAWKNRTVTEAVAEPFFKDTRYSDMHNTRMAIQDLISKATGFSSQEYSEFERSVRKGMIAVGMNPDLPAGAVRTLNSMVRFVKINSANVGFAAEHAYFSLFGAIDMSRMHTDRKAMGLPTGNFYGSLGKFLDGWSDKGMFRNADDVEGLKWFDRKGGFIDNYYDDPKYKGTGGKVWGALSHGLLNQVINPAKQASFLMAYNYGKDIMPKQEALQFALNHASRTMQSFNTLDRPQVFGDGMIGNMFRPFNQIHFYNLARMTEALESERLAVQSGQGKGLNTLAQKAMLGAHPFLKLSGLFLLLSGAQGIFGHDDWDNYRHWSNEFLGTTLGSIEETMSAMHFPDWLTWGAIPTITNMDTRGTFNTSFMHVLSTAGLKMAFDMAKAAIEVGQYAFGQPVSSEAVYQTIKNLTPTTVHPWIEDAIAKASLNDNIPNNKLEPKSPRTPSEDLLAKITSKQPLSESMRDEKVQLQMENTAMNQKLKERYINMITDSMVGLGASRLSTSDLMSKAVDENIGFTAQSLDEAIAKQIRDKNLPKALTYIQQSAKTAAPERAARFNHIQQLISNGPQGFGE